MKRSTAKPTRAIVKFARQQPGGVIRWHEARDLYLEESEAARRDERMAKRNSIRLMAARVRGRNSVSGNRHYHLSLNSLLKRNFYRVEGTQGFYVLKATVFNSDHL